MLVEILAAAVFSGVISVDSAGIVREESAFFMSEANKNGAIVVAKKTLSNGALQAACRRALTLPQRHQIRQKLIKVSSQSLPEGVSFIDAKISNFKHQKRADGMACQGDVAILDEPYNLAGLALNTAWMAAESGDIALLRPMLQLSLKHERTQADAVALIASQTDVQSGLDYIDKHLQPEKLTLPQGKLAVGKMWFFDQRYQAAINVLATCDEPMCRQVLLDAEDALAQQQGDDLSSYF